MQLPFFLGEVAFILICGTILIICVSDLRNAGKYAVWMGNFYFMSCSRYITVDFKKVASNQLTSSWFHFGRKRVHQEKNKTIRNPKHNNSLKNFPYAIKKHLVIYQSNFYLRKYPVKSLKHQCKLISEQVKKTNESTKQYK